MNYRAIFFDADGVLIERPHLFSEQLESQHGIKQTSLKPFFEGPFLNCGLGRADLKEELQKVISDWGWRGSVDELISFWLTEGTKINGELIQLILDLKESGIRTYMTTHQEKYRGEHLRKTLGEGKVFDDVFYSARLGLAKKDPTFFEEVYQTVNEALVKLSSASIDKKDVLVVDDKQEIINIVQANGFDGYLYTNLKDFKDFLNK